MSAHSRSRGGPLVALVVVLLGWIGVRAALWENMALSPVVLPPALFVDADGSGTTAHDTGLANADADHAINAPATSSGVTADAPVAFGWPVATGWPVANSLAGENQPAQSRNKRQPTPGPYFEANRQASPPYVNQQPRPRTKSVPVHLASGHQMLWMAALARMPLPWDASHNAAVRPLPAPFYAAGREPVSRKRWSGDGWLMLRRGGGVSLATGAAPATYGASQIGAVVRYQLGTVGDHRPTAYVRATAALQGVKDKEVAFGVSARPIPSIPIIAALEARVTDQPGGTRVRPAAMVVTELARFTLPLGTGGEAYAQAGYVGGNFKTGFADGQVRIDKRVGQFGQSELRAGAGAWAGAQKGASRVDIGPTASVGVPTGVNSAARLGVDWRFRVSGNARPRSGPAITLSAGF